MTDRNLFPSYGSVDPVQVAVVKPEFDVNEFNSICETITTKIYRIQNSVSNLSSALRQIEINQYTVTLRDHIHDIQQKTKPIINVTTQHLQLISTMARSGNKQHKLQADRLRNKFREIVQYYSNLQKQIAEKIKTVLLQSNRAESLTQATEWTTNYDNEVDDKTRLLEKEADIKAAQKQLSSEIQFEHELMLEREQRIRQIESDLIDVNEIFCDLAAMVNEQGEVIDTLENHVEDTCNNVEQGTSQLQRAATYQKKYRKKICCLMLLLLIIAIVIIIIIYATKK